MPCKFFLLPSHIIANLEKFFSNFWYSSSIHWMRWERLCQKKEERGLNFWSLREFNKALFAKQVWRFISQPELLVSRVFKQKYFPWCELSQAVIRPNSRFIWRGLFSTKHIVLHGMASRIGDRMKVNIWRENWLPSVDIPRVMSGMMAGFRGFDGEWSVLWWRTFLEWSFTLFIILPWWKTAYQEDSCTITTMPG